MSFNRQGGGFFQPPLYLFSDQKEYYKQLKSYPAKSHFNSDNLIYKMVSINSGMTNSEREILKEACKRVAVSFMIEKSDYAKLLLEDEEYEKANSHFARKQYDSKLLQKIADYFSSLLNLSHDEPSMLALFFYSDIMLEYQSIAEELVNKTFAPLKKKISTIASGVKASCYLENKKVHPFEEKYLPKRWNEYLKSKIGYDYNHQSHASNITSTLMIDQQDRTMTLIWQKSLLDDSEFWNAHKDFYIFSFLDAVERENSSRHAEKIFDYMCNELIKLDNIKLMIENNLPLYMAYKDQLIESLEKQAHRFTFAGLRPYCDIKLLDNEAICVPMCTRDDEKLSCGKLLFSNWIYKYNYPNDGKKVLKYIEYEIDRFVNGETQENDNIAVILDGSIFCYSAESIDRRVFATYFPDCFFKENIFNRVYMTAYAVTLLTSDEKRRFDYLNRIYIDLILAIEKKIGVCIAGKTDFISRDEQYSALKKKMSEFDIDISDEYKQEYIIALLDRETALLKESERFPELEQLGDAVYGFAVAERLFYHPEFNSDYEKAIEKYTCASAQTELSKHFGFNKLYLHTGISAKYADRGSLYYDFDSYILKQEEEQAKNCEKYLADSLEMLIGVLCIDKGINTALDFAKRLLQDHFKEDFDHKEIHDTKETRKSVEDKDYWDKILPSLNECFSGDNFYLLLAFNKLMLALSLGTNDKAKRNYITYAYTNLKLSDESNRWTFFDYLHKGLDYAISEHKEEIVKTYNAYHIKH